MSILRLVPVLPLLLAALVAAGASPAAASGAEYAGHVVHCAQEMGFSGTHNPGVHHQGYSRWQQHDC